MPSVLQPAVLQRGFWTLVTGAAMVAGAIAAWCNWQHHFWTALKGPTEVTLEQLAKIERPEQLPSTWIKVRFEKAVKTEVALVEKQLSSERVEQEYLLFQVGERWMIATVKPGFQGNVLAGQIYHNAAQLNNEAFVAVYKDYQHIHQGKLFPFEMHAQDYGGNWKTFAGVMAGLVVLGVVLGVVGCFDIRHSFSPPPPGEAEAEVDFSALPPQTAVQAEDTIARFMREAAERDR